VSSASLQSLAFCFRRPRIVGGETGVEPSLLCDRCVNRIGPGSNRPRPGAAKSFAARLLGRFPTKHCGLGAVWLRRSPRRTLGSLADESARRTCQSVDVYRSQGKLGAPRGAIMGKLDHLFASSKPYVSDGGLETDLIFQEGGNFPLFAAFVLSAATRGARCCGDTRSPVLTWRRRMGEGSSLAQRHGAQTAALRLVAPRGRALRDQSAPKLT
jgi:hypothetical protein